MKDIADPHSSSRVRDAVNSARLGASAAWMIEGSCGLALTR
jgi:hypothetical protein